MSMGGRWVFDESSGRLVRPKDRQGRFTPAHVAPELAEAKRALNEARAAKNAWTRDPTNWHAEDMRPVSGGGFAFWDEAKPEHVVTLEHALQLIEECAAKTRALQDAFADAGARLSYAHEKADPNWVRSMEPQPQDSPAEPTLQVEPVRPNGVRRPVGKRTRFAIFHRDGFRCRYCGRSAPDVVLHVDHAVSVKDGGLTTPQNLVTACQDCNLGKSAKSVSFEEVRA